MPKCCERPIKLSLKCLICMVDLDFCITYLKNTKFNLVNYLTATKIVLVYCSNYTNIVSSAFTIHAGIF